MTTNWLSCQRGSFYKKHFMQLTNKKASRVNLFWIYLLIIQVPPDILGWNHFGHLIRNLHFPFLFYQIFLLRNFLCPLWKNIWIFIYFSLFWHVCSRQNFIKRLTNAKQKMNFGVNVKPFGRLRQILTNIISIPSSLRLCFSFLFAHFLHSVSQIPNATEQPF